MGVGVSKGVEWVYPMMMSISGNLYEYAMRKLRGVVRQNCVWFWTLPGALLGACWQNSYPCGKPIIVKGGFLPSVIALSNRWWYVGGKFRGELRKANFLLTNPTKSESVWNFRITLLLLPVETRDCLCKKTLRVAVDSIIVIIVVAPFVSTW